MAMINTGVITADKISRSSDSLELPSFSIGNNSQEHTWIQARANTDDFRISTSSQSSLTPYNSINKGDLVFLEMKIENKNEYMLITMIYIDKKNYQEVRKTFTCDLSYSEKHDFYIGNNNSIPNIKLELKNIPEITEERIDL